MAFTPQIAARSFLFVAGLVAAAIWGPSPARGARCEDPGTLTFSVIPTEKVVTTTSVFEPLASLLERQTGKKTRYFAPADYSEAVFGLWAREVDVAILGPFSYIVARKKDPSIEVFATYFKLGGEVHEAGPGYRSALISKKGGGFTSIESLKGAKLGLTDVASTSGNLVPSVLFAEQVGSSLSAYFGAIYYTGAHDLSIKAVHGGGLDAAFVGDYHIDNVIASGEVTLDDFNVLWRSPRIPHDPFVYRGTLCEGLKRKIAEAFLGLKGDPTMREFLNATHASGLVGITASDYDLIEELADRKKAHKTPAAPTAPMR